MRESVASGGATKVDAYAPDRMAGVTNCRWQVGQIGEHMTGVRVTKVLQRKGKVVLLRAPHCDFRQFRRRHMVGLARDQQDWPSRLFHRNCRLLHDVAISQSGDIPW